MQNALVIAVIVLAAALAITLLRLRAPSASTPAATDLSGLLPELLRQLDRSAAQQREEIGRMVAEQGSAAMGQQVVAIDQRMKAVQDDVTARLGELAQSLVTLQSATSEQYSRVDTAVAALAQRTATLHDVLSNAQRRGQWGERLAEDILRSVGLVEGVNYSKQAQIDGGGRPDYRFEMPPDRVLFMDVKFPLEQYTAFLQAPDDVLRAQARSEFIKALRGHVDALAKRDYVDKAEANTIDYVLMFVPNESISAFVHESDPALIDWALGKKVVLCTPLTLYAFLVVVRQAAESFHTEKAAAEIMRRINLFQQEWGKYTAAVDDVEKQYAKLAEALHTINTGGTRFNKLNVQVREIEKIRRREGIPEADATSAAELEAGDDA
ncbi:MAG: hypothetical protein RLZ04_321 [Actinomycetota bacterium]|jgi:DNA recombination protein RmuC